MPARRPPPADRAAFRPTAARLVLRRLRASLGDVRGNVAIMFAVALPLLLGFTSLVVDYGNGLVLQANDQRVSDLAAYAGALSYSAANSTTEMRNAALAAAALNGVGAGSVAVDLVSSPRGGGAQAVRATIAVDNPLFFAPILGVSPTQRVTTVAYAEIAGPVADCVLALDGTQSGITLSGGTAISAPACSVDSNAGIAVPCGTTLTAKTVLYFSTAAPSQPCNGITAGQISRAQTPDPLLGNSGLAAVGAHLAAVAELTVGAAPQVPQGTSISFGYDQPSTIKAVKLAGCAATFAGSLWTLTCPSGGSYAFGDVTLGGGISVNFNTGGSATTSFSFSGTISNSGAALAFGPGSYAIGHGIRTGNGSTTSFGAGTFRVGPDTVACNGAGYYSICNASTLSFAGPSSFALWAGIQNGGGATLALGAGSTNSFSIGPASNGEALTLGGGSKTTLADATGATSLFQLIGNVDDSGGGNCLTLGAAAQHDIVGSFIASGGVVLGAGVYSLDGYMALGAAGGGATSCNGATVSLYGQGVSIVLSGRTTPSSGTCAGYAFCLGAGYNNAVLTAPSAGTTASMAVIGPLSPSVTAGANFAEGGAGGQVAGLIYFPTGPLTMSGGASLSGGGACLQLVGSRIALSGGSLLASQCFSGGSGSGKVRLVQ